MTPRFTLTLCFLALSFNCLLGQITIESSDLADVGDMVSLDLGDTLLMLDPEPSGPDFFWDFSFLDALNQVEIDYVAPATTDFTYILLWPSSNIAAPFQAPTDFAGIAVEDAVEFFHKNSDRWQQTGLAGTIGGIPVPFLFDPPDRIVEFPMNFGDTHGGPSAFALEVPGVLGLWEDRDRSCEVDGWGSLLLSGGTHEVLRQRCEIAIHDSITGSFGDFEIIRTTREFRWWGKAHDVPLLQIDEQELAGLSTVSRIAFQGQATGSTGIRDISEDFQVVLSDDRLLISHLTPGTSLQIFDASGRIIRQLANLPYSASVSLDASLRGLLLLEFSTEDARGTQKVLVH